MQVFNQGDQQAWSHDPLVYKQLRRKCNTTSTKVDNQLNKTVYLT